MAINQDRILALLNEADAHRRVHSQLLTQLRETIRAASSDPSVSKADLCVLLTYTINTIPHVPWEAHTVERYHFTRNARRNTKLRERARRVRRARSSDSYTGATSPLLHLHEQTTQAIKDLQAHNEAEDRQLAKAQLFASSGGDGDTAADDDRAEYHGPLSSFFLQTANGDEELARELWEDSLRYVPSIL